MSWRWLALAGGVAIVWALFRSRAVERPLGTLGTIELPRRARLGDVRTPDETPDWVTFRFDRVHPWAMGSFTPYQANLFVNVHSADAAADGFAAALRANARELNGGSDDYREIESGGRWRIGAGRYRVNLLDEPTWRIGYLDSDRRLSISWQVWQKDWNLDAARKAVVAMAESVRLGTTPDFAGIRDRPRQEALERERVHDAALAWLADRGFGALAPGVAIERDGIVVEYQTDPERRLTLLRVVPADDTTDRPGWLTRGWRTKSDTGWVDENRSNDYWPSSGIRSWLDEWATTRGERGPIHYLIRTIRMDETPETGYHLSDFFDVSRRAE